MTKKCKEIFSRKFKGWYWNEWFVKEYVRLWNPYVPSTNAKTEGPGIVVTWYSWIHQVVCYHYRADYLKDLLIDILSLLTWVFSSNIHLKGPVLFDSVGYTMSGYGTFSISYGGYKSLESYLSGLSGKIALWLF